MADTHKHVMHWKYVNRFLGPNARNFREGRAWTPKKLYISLLHLSLWYNYILSERLIPCAVFDLIIHVS